MWTWLVPSPVPTRFASLTIRLGVIRSYKLTYESTAIQHAIFDRSTAINEWSIEPKFLKEITDHFSPSAEQLDIYSENTKVIFTSFTAKITHGKGMHLKGPRRELR
jgi:cell cycle checkpoint control protein RAD9A